MTATGLLLPASIDDLRERLADAAVTLRRVPSPRHSRPSESLSAAWPAYIREFFDAYGYESATPPRMRATAAQIGRMGEVLDWIAAHWPASVCERAGLAPDSGRVAWLRAAGWRWPKIAEYRRRQAAGKGAGGPSGLAGGNTVRSLYTIEQRALAHMLARLRGTVAEEPSLEMEDLARPVRIDVVVDHAIDERVAMVRAGGTLVATVQTRHARATHEVVPGRQR